MKKLVLTLFISCVSLLGFSQKYLTQNATISFFSETPIENIEATNNQASSVINLKTGEVVFSLLMKAFTFEKALMQEHFNEKYVESDDYPKATFKGTIQDLEIILSSNETFDLFVTGQLTMHGKTKNVETPVKITYKGETIEAECDFVVSPAYFDIKIPNAVKENIAKEIKVTVNATYDEFK